MGRKITMTGKNAQYIEHRGVNATPDNDREICLEGDEAVYQEYAYGWYSQAKQEEKNTEDAVKEYQKEDKTLLEKIKRDDNPPEELLIPEAQSEEVKGKTPVLSDDEKIVRAIAILNKEKLIKHKYDYTWVMQVMKETDGMPSFDSPQSFLNHMKKLHIEGLPDISNMNKELNKLVGKFPKWTFIDKDKPETDRRINIARRFYNAYWKGI